MVTDERHPKPVYSRSQTAKAVSRKVCIIVVMARKAMLAENLTRNVSDLLRDEQRV